MSDERLEQWRREHLGRLLLCAFQTFERDMLDGLERSGIRGLRMSHFVVLRNVDLAGSRITAIAERAGLTKQAIGPLVRELEEAGVLTVGPDPADGRAKLVRFTAAGKRGLQKAQAVYGKIWQRYVRQVGEREMNRLRDGLATFLVGADADPRGG